MHHFTCAAILLLGLVAPGKAQSSTPAPTASVSATDSAATPATTVGTSTSSATGDGSWAVYSDGTTVGSIYIPGPKERYSQLVASGSFKPAAASYYISEVYKSNPITTQTAGSELDYIEGRLQAADSELFGAGLESDAGLLTRLSAEAYFISDLPATERPYASTFYSVFYRLQDITADASQSTRLHAMATSALDSNTFGPSTTRTPNAAAHGRPSNVMSGAVVGLFVGLLGML